MTYEEKEYKQTKVIATTIVAAILIVLSGAILGPQACLGRNAVRCRDMCVSGCKHASSESFECQSAPTLNGKADLNVNLRSNP